MRVRLQQSNVRHRPTYHKDVQSVVVYDDSDTPIFVVIPNPCAAGAGYMISHVGMPEFERDINTIFKYEVENASTEEI